MNELHYGIEGEIMRVFHHIVFGLAFIKGCPLINKDDYATERIMTTEWFNSIVDWLCDNFPEEFSLKEVSKETE